jgi:ATP-dependent DNA ligase
MALPISPPIPPMLAKLVDAIPSDDGWAFEPKWDGFRAIVFFDGREAYVQSRDMKPLARYFPELQERLQAVLPHPLVLDGEVVIMTPHGLDFGSLSQRIHPAESRVRKLAAETPSAFVAFDVLADGNADFRGAPFRERRALLEEALAGIVPPAYLTPMTRNRGEALDWFERFEGAGLDGIIAKRDDGAYQAGVRAMLKIKHLRTVDCAVGGFRWNRGEEERSVGSLLLGLYGDDEILHHVGHTSSFKAAEKKALVDVLKPYVTDDASIGFGAGRTPGGPSRWTGARDLSWVRVRPELVCEVTFDHLQGDRFRHAATFRRWRPDKPPRDCTFDQVATTVPFLLDRIFAP